MMSMENIINAKRLRWSGYFSERDQRSFNSRKLTKEYENGRLFDMLKH